MRATIFESCFSTRSLRLPKTLVRILGIGLGFAIPGCGRYSIGHHKRTCPPRLELAAKPADFKESRSGLAPPSPCEPAGSLRWRVLLDCFCRAGDNPPRASLVAGLLASFLMLTPRLRSEPAPSSRSRRICRVATPALQLRRAYLRTYAIGFTSFPSCHTSKCTCGPVDRPEVPASEITSPACTCSPTCASSLLLCA